MFESVDEVQQRFRDARYIASRRVSTVVYLAARMGRPVLIEGPAGVGKTELAKTLSEITGRPLIRLQCYEGLDEGKALYEWKYAKQLLYTQLLRERIGELIADAPSLPDAVAQIAGQEDAFFSFRFLSPRPLLSAIQAEEPVVLLVDEIDKAEPEFEAFLLEVLSDFQVSVPELGHGAGPPHPARRPDVEQRPGALRRPQAPVPAPLHRLPGAGRRAGDHPAEGAGDLRRELARAVVAAVQKIRALDLRKPPSVSESLDWARSLVILNARELDPALVESTLTLLVKYEKDLERVKGSLDKVLARRSPWTSESSSSSATCAGPRSASRRSEALDALAASAEVGLSDRETFKATLAATLSRSSATIATFDRLFNLYFLDLEALGEGLKKALGPEDPRVQEHARRSPGQRGHGARRADRAAHARAGQRDGDGHPLRRPERGLERLMYFLQVGFFSRRISDNFDWSAIERDLERIMKAARGARSRPGQLARIRNYLELRLEAFSA